MVLPTEVKATGPKGYLSKGDVLAYIESKNLQKGQRKESSKASSAPSKAAPKKKAAPPKD